MKHALLVTFKQKTCIFGPKNFQDHVSAFRKLNLEQGQVLENAHVRYISMVSIVRLFIAGQYVGHPLAYKLAM